MGNEGINFNGIGVAESTAYVTPGYRVMYFGKCEAISSTAKGTPGIQFLLNNGEGGTFKADFWLSAGALPRIQYLHKAVFGKLLNEVMTPGELAAYFNKGISPKKPYNFIIGGKKSGDKTYCELPFTNFIVPDGEGFVAGDFTHEDEKRYIRASADQSAVNASNAAVIGSDDIILS